MEPSKFYYDITIEHDTEHADKKHFVRSKVEKNNHPGGPPHGKPWGL